MKKLFLIIGATSLLFGACVSNPEGEKAVTSEAGEVLTSEGTKLSVDTEASTLEWTGRKVSATHNGVIKISSGTVQVEGDQITAGQFTIDMNSLENFDQEGEWKEKLENHLKSDDFFYTEKFPEAKLEITNVEGNGVGTVTVSANLTIKDITKGITFMAEIAEISESSLEATANFNIERFDWGITYPGMADDLISEEINFNVKLIAN